MTFSDNLAAYADGYNFGLSGEPFDSLDIPDEFLIPFYNGYQDGTDAAVRGGYSL